MRAEGFSRTVLAWLIAVVPAALPACASDRPQPSSPHAMHAVATAYCQSGTTKSGAQTRRGIIAADPRVLPLGTVVHIDAPQQSRDGVYTVLDTGSAVKGRIVDIFEPDCRRAKRFGRRPVVVKVLDWGDGRRTQPPKRR